MAKFMIEVPDCDAHGTPIDVYSLSGVLYVSFGWKRGDVRVLVAQVTDNVDTIIKNPPPKDSYH